MRDDHPLDLDVLAAAERVVRRMHLRRTALRTAALALGLPLSLVLVALLTLHHPMAPLVAIGAVAVAWRHLILAGERPVPVRVEPGHH